MDWKKLVAVLIPRLFSCRSARYTKVSMTPGVGFVYPVEPRSARYTKVSMTSVVEYREALSPTKA